MGMIGSTIIVNAGTHFRDQFNRSQSQNNIRTRGKKFVDGLVSVSSETSEQASAFEEIGFLIWKIGVRQRFEASLLRKVSFNLVHVGNLVFIIC